MRGELILVRSGLFYTTKEKRYVCLSKAPFVSRAGLGKSDNVKLMQVP